MKLLLEQNIYDIKGNILICGTCLQKMQPIGYKKLIKEYDNVLFICLEKEHINMAITKICAAISTGNIKKLTFASVNRSPHCIQLHYIKNEILRVINKNLPLMKNIIIENNELHEIDDNIISLSKNLVKLQNERISV